MKLPEIVTKNPVASVAVALGGGFVFYVIAIRPRMGGGTTQIVATTPQASDAQIAASAQTNIAQIASNRDIQLGAFQLKAAELAGELETNLATLAAQVQSGKIDAEKAVNLASINANLEGLKVQTDAAKTVQLAGLDSQKSMWESLVTMLTKVNTPVPQPAPTIIYNEAPVTAPSPQPPAPVVTPTQPAPANDYALFDPFNTSNKSQPLLQGLDAFIAQEIDRGNVKVLGGSMFQIAGDTNSAAGVYVSDNPIDARWGNYVKGTYTATGGTGF